MKKELTIESCEPKKSGVGSRGAWVLYECVAGGTKYSTFTDLLKCVGRPVWYEVEQKQSDKVNPKTGKNYVNWTIKGYAPIPKENVATGQIQPKEADVVWSMEDKAQLFALIGDMSKKVDRLLEKPF